MNKEEQNIDGFNGISKHILLSGLFAVLFIVITGVLGLYYSNEFCFLFHLIPFGIGFSGGSILYIVGYYLILFIALWLMGIGLFKFFNQIKVG